MEEQQHLQVRFNAGLAAVRRAAALIIGQPFGTGNLPLELQGIAIAASAADGDGDQAEANERAEEGVVVEKEEKEGNQVEVAGDGGNCDSVVVEGEEQSCQLVGNGDQRLEGQLAVEDPQLEGGDQMESSEDEDDEDNRDEYFSDSSSDGPKSDTEVQRMIDWLVEIESEAADAQEHLEDESLKNVEDEIRLELSKNLTKHELDMAVARERADYVSQWERSLTELEVESAKLQDRLQDAGVSLPDLYKSIEKLTPGASLTETWRKRAHWAGTEAPEDYTEVLESAEKVLEAQRPVMRHRGKLVEEGASGFLQSKVIDVDAVKGTMGWEIFDGAFQAKPSPGGLFNTDRWAAVYSASTPEQAARLGLKFPGVDKVDDIADIDQHLGLEAIALAQESEFGLTEKQKQNIKRVREEDDVRQMHKRPGTRRPDYAKATTTSQIKSSADIVDDLKDSAAVSSMLQPDHIPPQRDEPRSPEPENKLEKSTETEPIVADQTTVRDRPIVDELVADEATIRDRPIVDQQPARVDEKLTNSSIKAQTVKKESTNLVENLASETMDRAASPLVTDDGKRVTSGAGKATSMVTETINLGKCSNKRSIEKSTTIAAAARPEVIVVSDDDATDCVSTIRTKPVEQGGLPEAAAMDETTSPLKPMRRATEAGCSSKSNKRKRNLVIESSESEQDDCWIRIEKTEAAKDHRHDNKSIEAARDADELQSDSCEITLSKQDTRAQISRKFGCTACGRTIPAKEVFSHPVLQVIVCNPCRQQYENGPFSKDEDGSEAECRWCGEGGNMICCDNCDKVFCEACIGRNFGALFLETIEEINWKCYLCDPSPLLGLQKLRKDAEAESAAELQQELNVKRLSKRRRRNIRKVIADDELDEATKEKLALEKERRERLEKWYAAAALSKSLYKRSARAEKTIDGREAEHHICEGDCKAEGCVINVASRETDEPLVRIPVGISRFLKPHQLSGVRFMWENCIQSIQKVKSGADALGCILAHSMGLGKTLQVIAFLYTVMRNVDLGFKTALVVVPVNVLHNWQREFEKWRPAEVLLLQVFMLDAHRDNATKASLLKSWKENGGVMLIGYAAFRNLSTGNHVKDRETRDTLCECLQNPGPDLLVCDEAHTIKNDKADITIALQQVKTGRRIALTGSPLQNNLMEYYCMVDFVRRGFLGPPNIFRNKFQNPIANGQHADSTAEDVKSMKKTTHILHKRLSGFVQRRDMTVLKDELPPKCVWVISVRLSPLQKKLYKLFLNVCEAQRSKLFDHYHVLAKIWNHPDLLAIARDQHLTDDFIVSSDKEDSGENVSGSTKPAAPEANIYDWCADILNGSKRDDLENSGKMVLIMSLLSMSSSRNDKMLIFSQSLQTLDLIETFLKTIPLRPSQGVWTKGREWLRIDGSTSASRRQQIADTFNDPGNMIVKCLLISTRAGSLGMNMTGASRVIIVDGSWNPTHDLQALFRSWRYGQTKPVFVYRLLAYGTMEEKIYNRQLTKEGVAARVLDAHQVGRHLNADDLELLYTFDDADDDEMDQADGNEQQQQQEQQPASAQKPKHKTFSMPSDAPPRDELMALLLLEYRPQWIAQYHEHEPLLEDLEDEKLTLEEMKTAWDGFMTEHEQGQTQRNSPSQAAPPVQMRYTPPPQPPPPPSAAAASSGGGGGARPVATPTGLRCRDAVHEDLLRKLSVPAGGSVVCGTCLQKVQWETLGKQHQRQHQHQHQQYRQRQRQQHQQQQQSAVATPTK